MIELPLFITKLKALLPESSWSWVLSALAQDRHIWNLVHDPNFAFQALDRIGSQPQRWTPGNLALLYYDPDIYSEPISLDSGTRKTALHTYESFLKGQSADHSDQDFLKQAFLLAAALLEHRRLSGSWSLLPADLKPIPPAYWDTTLACLYGLATDSSALLGSLLSHTSPKTLLKSGLHALFSNPLTPAEQSRLLQDMLASQPMPEWIPVLQELERIRPQLAGKIARHLLTKQPIFANRKRYQQNYEQVKHLTYLLALSELQRMAGEMGQGEMLHHLAVNAVDDLHARLARQKIDVLVQTGNLKEAVTHWNEMMAAQPGNESSERDHTPPNILILSMLEKDLVTDAADLIHSALAPSQPEDYPIYHLVKAHQAADGGDLSTARKAAKQALNKVNNRASGLNMTSQNSPVSGEIEQMLNLITQTLLNLDLPDQALTAAQKVNQLQPNNPDALIMLAKAQCAASDTDQALVHAHLATALEPESVTRRHQLALFLEASGRWEEALSEWQTLLDEGYCLNGHEDGSPITTLHSAANCAVKAGDLDLASNICQQILDSQPDDGIAHTLSGEKLILQGDVQSALDHYRQGTELAPDLAYPWLRMAKAQKEKGLPGNAVDTLRQAAQAVPGDPAVHLALAELYLAENALTQALTSLQHAQGLVTQPLLVSKTNPWEYRRKNQHKTVEIGEPLPCQVATLLGETLRLLGHIADARQIFEDAYQDYPGSIELARKYAKTLLSLGEHGDAIEPLKKVVESNPDELEPYLDYGYALLNLECDPEEAVRVLRMAENLFPGNPQTTALLAEALEQNGNLDDSQQNFYQAMQSDLAKDPEWHSRLSYGLGKVSLQLSQAETAIASLQESIQSKPDNPKVHRTLAEAYASLNLKDEALESARVAISQAPDEAGMLVWFANLSTQMGSLNEAISTLERYVEMQPEDTGMLVKLGQVELRAGKKSNALITLKNVLSKQGASVEDLRQAACGLMELEDPDSAATFLERAIEQQPDPDPKLLLELATAYKQAGRSHQALETLDKAIDQDPQKAFTFLAKADLLAGLGRTEDVLTCLEGALDLHPDDPELRYHLALQLRAAGDISSALSHAVKLVASIRKNCSLPDIYSARALAANLARAIMQPEYARSFLINTTDAKSSEKPETDQNKEASPLATADPHPLDQKLSKLAYRSEPSAFFSYYCLVAELALDEGEEISAAEALNQAIEYNPAHPRLLALQSRLANRRGDSAEAAGILQNTLEFLGKDTQWSQMLDATDQTVINGDSLEGNQQDLKNAITAQTLCQKQDLVCTLFGISSAAIELGEWETALYMLEKAAQESPGEPYSHFQMARALVLRAEYQRLCQTLDVIEHAPGSSAVDNDSFKAFQSEVQALSQRLSAGNASIGEDSGLLVSHWHKRGRIAFQVEGYTNPADSCAIDDFLSVLERDADEETRSSNLGYSKYSKDPLQHSLSLAQLAISSGTDEANKETHAKGVLAAQAALRLQPKQPIFHALLAYLAKHSGDLAAGLNSMLSAVSTWPEEPRWQAIIANYYLELGDPLAAVEHLHKAVELEPGFMGHHLALGEAYLKNGDRQLAIQSLNQAHRLAPDELNPNLALARAYIMDHDPTSATTYADQAVNLAPDRPEPLQLLAEIALQSNEPKTAISKAKAALHLDPNMPETLCLMARALSKMNQYDEALSVLDTAIPLTGKPLPILLERAKLLEVSRGSAKALEALQALVKDYPDEPGIQANLARNLAAEGQSQEAIQAAQNALHTRDINWEPGEQANLHLLLGSLLRKAGQLDQAIHHLTEAIRLSPKEVQPYLELAATQQDRRQHILALQTYEKAMEVAPDNPLPYYQASLALKDGRDYEGAERLLRKAAYLAPDDVSIHRQLAALVALNLVHNRRSVSVEA